MKLFAYLKLMRISALPTLWSNVLVALWIGLWSWHHTGPTSPRDSIFLPLFSILSASFFYLAGMVLNDFFDAKIDAVERPERVIPSGQISRCSAGFIGLSLLVSGWFCVEGCYRLQEKSMIYSMAAMTTVCIVGYDAFLKRIPIIGPITMGACRFFNIFFVLAATGYATHWNDLSPLRFEYFHWDMFYPWLIGIYVAGLTVLSRYEGFSPKIQRFVGSGLSLLIPLDALICLYFFGPAPAFAILCLYPLALLLRRIVPMS